MNSYTISDLVPSTSYIVILGLKKNNHVIPISELLVTTRPESYMHQLGIRKDFTALSVVIIVLMGASIACVCVSVPRFYRVKCAIQSDTMSTKGIILSPSEQGSLGSYSSYAEEKGKVQEDLDKNYLVQNEAETAAEDLTESIA